MASNEPRYSLRSSVRKARIPAPDSDEDGEMLLDDKVPGSPETPTPVPKSSRKRGGRRGRQLGDNRASGPAPASSSRPTRRVLFPEAPNSGPRNRDFVPVSRSMGGPPTPAAVGMLASSQSPVGDNRTGPSVPTGGGLVGTDGSFGPQQSTFAPADPASFLELWSTISTRPNPSPFAPGNSLARRGNLGRAGNVLASSIDPRLLALATSSATSRPNIATTANNPASSQGYGHSGDLGFSRGLGYHAQPQAAGPTARFGANRLAPQSADNGYVRIIHSDPSNPYTAFLRANQHGPSADQDPRAGGRSISTASTSDEQGLHHPAYPPGFPVPSSDFPTNPSPTIPAGLSSSSFAQKLAISSALGDSSSDQNHHNNQSTQPSRSNPILAPLVGSALSFSANPNMADMSSPAQNMWDSSMDDPALQSVASQLGGNEGDSQHPNMALRGIEPGIYHAMGQALNDNAQMRENIAGIHASQAELDCLSTVAQVDTESEAAERARSGSDRVAGQSSESGDAESDKENGSENSEDEGDGVADEDEDDEGDESDDSDGGPAMPHIPDVSPHEMYNPHVNPAAAYWVDVSAGPFVDQRNRLPPLRVSMYAGLPAFDTDPFLPFAPWRVNQLPPFHLEASHRILIVPLRFLAAVGTLYPASVFYVSRHPASANFTSRMKGSAMAQSVAVHFPGVMSPEIAADDANLDEQQYILTLVERDWPMGTVAVVPNTQEAQAFVAQLEQTFDVLPNGQEAFYYVPCDLPLPAASTNDAPAAAAADNAAPGHNTNNGGNNNNNNNNNPPTAGPNNTAEPPKEKAQGMLICRAYEGRKGPQDEALIRDWMLQQGAAAVGSVAEQDALGRDVLMRMGEAWVEPERWPRRQPRRRGRGRKARRVEPEPEPERESEGGEDEGEDEGLME